MEIGPINPLTMGAPVNTPPPAQDDASFVRQIVSAIRGLNEAGVLGQGREIAFTRDLQTHHLIIQIRDADTGEIIDQIPTAAVLHMAVALDKLQPKGIS